MNDDVRNIVLGVVATAISGGFGWFARTYLWRRTLRRKQAFFGLPSGSDCLFVVNRQMGGTEGSVHRNDAFALLEISALIKDCGANLQIVSQDTVRQGFGERAEFCVGGSSPTRGRPPTWGRCCRASGWTSVRRRVPTGAPSSSARRRTAGTRAWWTTWCWPG